MPCTETTHDLRFTYQEPDDVFRDIVYDDDDVPTITETTRSVFECRLCYRRIYGTPHTRTYTPEPARVIYSAKEPVRYEYDI